MYRGNSLFTRCWLLQQRAWSWAENADKSLHQQLEKGSACEYISQLCKLFSSSFSFPHLLFIYLFIFLPLCTLSMRWCSCYSYLCTTSSLLPDQASCSAVPASATLPAIALNGVWFSFWCLANLACSWHLQTVECFPELPCRVCPWSACAQGAELW